jgi:hypothetical protein
MKHHTVDPPLSRFYRNPVLTAIMVTSLIFGATTSLAGIALWRASSACADDAPVVTDVVQRSELLIQRAEPPQGDSARSREAVSACPCAATTEWHWRI